MPVLSIPQLLDLPFKGSRDYLHSTDLFPALSDLARQQFSPQAFVELLTIRRAVNRQVQVQFELPLRSFGSFRMRNGRERINGWLVETQEPIRRRIPFDESTAMKAAVVSPGSARFSKPLEGYTSFEQLMVLMHIVSQRVSPHAWWLCQMNLCSPIADQLPMEFQAKEQVAGRFLVGRICQDGRAIGTAAGFADFSRPLNARHE